jgi:hypothetical protein
LKTRRLLNISTHPGEPQRLFGNDWRNPWPVHKTLDLCAEVVNAGHGRHCLRRPDPDQRPLPGAMVDGQRLLFFQ